jgi:hypothetical protein
MEIFESFVVLYTVGLEINPGELLLVVLQLQSVGLKEAITINEPFYRELPFVLYMFKKVCELP